MREDFDIKDFSLRVKEELEYLGMEISHLANCIYVPEHKLFWKLSYGAKGKVKFKPEEIKAIEKVLGMN
jgi:hypothetical protein